jgi:hypothetical protein
MAGNSKIEVVSKQSEESSGEQKRFFSRLGDKISDSFKMMGKKIRERNSKQQDPSNNPYIQAQTFAERREKAEGGIESFLQRIPGILAIAGAAAGAYIAGIPPMYIIIGVVVFLLIIFLSAGKLVLQISIILIIIVVLVFGGTALWPLAQAYARENQESNPAMSAIAEATEFTKTMRDNLNMYIETQIECASGNCPQGEAEGEYVGISLSTPALMRPDKEYSAGDPLTISTDVEGVNLRIYSDITAETNCSIVKNSSLSISPAKIPFADISNRKRTISCVLNAVKTNSNINTIKTSISFPFNTTSDLKVYVMGYNRRNLMLEMWGNDFLSTHYNLDPDPTAKFNDGPINLGIRVNQIPIGIGSGVEDNPAELTFALFNQWGYYGGEIINIDDIEITLPGNMEIYAVGSEEDDACPFEKGSGTSYNLKKKDDLSNYTIKTVRSFVCGLKVGTPSGQNFDVWTGHIRITAKYQYRLTSKLNINLKTGEAEAVAGEDPYTGTGSSSGTFDFTATCDSSLTSSSSSTLPASYAAAYESGKFSEEIKAGLAAATSQYKLDWLSEDQMRDMLLGIMTQESGVGTNPDADFNSKKDAGREEGTPNHIAGCTCTGCATPDNIESDIVCAAERINRYTQSDGTCGGLSTPNEFLTCAVAHYNSGPDEAGYARNVESFMAQWHNYFCSKTAGVTV